MTDDDTTNKADTDGALKGEAERRILKIVISDSSVVAKSSTDK